MNLFADDVMAFVFSQILDDVVKGNFSKDNRQAVFDGTFGRADESRVDE